MEDRQFGLNDCELLTQEELCLLDSSTANAIFFDTSGVEASSRKMSKTRNKRAGVSSKAGWCEERDGVDLSLQSVSMLATRMLAVQNVRASAKSLSTVAILLVCGEILDTERECGGKDGERGDRRDRPMLRVERFVMRTGKELSGVKRMNSRRN